MQYPAPHPDSHCSSGVPVLKFTLLPCFPYPRNCQVIQNLRVQCLSPILSCSFTGATNTLLLRLAIVMATCDGYDSSLQPVIHFANRLIFIKVHLLLHYSPQQLPTACVNINSDKTWHHSGYIFPLDIHPFPLAKCSIFCSLASRSFLMFFWMYGILSHPISAV